jgi:hypothetical protein
MSKEEVDQRKSSRIFFTLEEGITATISSLQDTAQSIPVTILSIGTGGLSFMVNRYKLPKVNEGDRLALTSICTPPPLGPIDRIEAVVKYVLDFQHSVRLSLGCEFIQNSELLVKRIEDYVQFRLKNLGFDH